MKLQKHLYVFLALLSIGFATSCSSDSDGTKDTTDDNPPVENKTVHKLPERSAKVYIGISHRWHQVADPANYNKWSYVRSNAAGFYTNFIAMWRNSYQNSKGPQESANNMQKAFKKNGAFFETSLETKVNNSAIGANNEETDKKYIDFLTNAGFHIDYTSLNYGVTSQRVKTLKNYKGDRECLTLAGPWTIQGDILKNNEKNNQLRENIIATDGMETDGPLGLWVKNTGNMRQGSYSLVDFAKQNKKTAAVMLAPFDGDVNADVPGYHATDDFLKVSKETVLAHEDHLASPDVWTIWTYQSDPGEPAFPESVVNAKGEKEPANTMLGVGYWLIKHLNTLPKIALEKGDATHATITSNGGGKVKVNIAKFDGTIQGTVPFKISNDRDPAIAISPVVRAIIKDKNQDWEINFKLKGKDVTDDVIYNGGLNFIGNKRLSKENALQLTMTVKARNDNPSPATISIKSMSNISNTANSEENYHISISK